jgi:predicted component of type VI protein secretion system
MECSPDEWLDSVASAMRTRRASPFPVEDGSAWRIGDYILLVEMDAEKRSAVAITAMERVSDNGNFDTASGIESFDLHLEEDPHIAAARVYEQLRGW